MSVPGYTTGAHYAAGVSGATQLLTRKTWFRWYYPGDFFSSAGYSRVQAINVSPTITTTTINYGGGRYQIRGGVARSGGLVSLYRLVGSIRVRVATVTIGPSGFYSFGIRSLAHGTYQVYASASTYWAASAKNIKL